MGGKGIGKPGGICAIPAFGNASRLHKAALMIHLTTPGNRATNPRAAPYAVHRMEPSSPADSREVVGSNRLITEWRTEAWSGRELNEGRIRPLGVRRNS